MSKNSNNWKSIKTANNIILLSLTVFDSLESTEKSKRLIKIQQNTIKAIKKLDKRKTINLALAALIMKAGVTEMELIQSNPM